MTTTAKALATNGASEPFAPTTIERRDVGPKDVLIDIKFAGICHSDIHTAQGHWGEIEYPFVGGHEIAGIVTQVGSDVTTHKVGDRVGVGCMVNSCRTCENCLAGLEQYCLNANTQTYNDINKYGTGERTQGGYASSIVVDEHFVLHIPDEIELSDAAPLLCAAITTYSPLKHWGVGAGTKIAVIGLGGLGHLAVQSAKALGAEVSVLSHTPEKKDIALELGATHFYDTTDEKTFTDAARQFDYILNTVAVEIDLNPYFPLLKQDGTIINVGAPGTAYPIDVFTLYTGRYGFAGSAIGGIQETQEVLDFCAEHNIRPMIEVIRADEINDAYKNIQDSKVRFRYVIDVATIA